MKVGVLALQGDFYEHFKALENAAHKLLPTLEKVEIVYIKTPEELEDGVDGLIIPGGESTVLTRHLLKNNFLEKLRVWCKNPAKFTWGTCAGLILMSDKIEGNSKGSVVSVGGLGITCSRNVSGRQIDSCERPVQMEDATLIGKEGQQMFPGVFIRPPGIKSVDMADVKVLCRLTDIEEYSVVGVQHDNVMACTFHPELTNDSRWHEYFLNQVSKRKIKS